MNWKGCGKKRSWPNLRLYPRICLEGLRKTTKNLSQDSRYPGRDLKPGPPEYEAGALTTRPRRSVNMKYGTVTDLSINCAQRTQKPLGLRLQRKPILYSAGVGPQDLLLLQHTELFQR
jgi:hypothetical protein